MKTKSYKTLSGEVIEITKEAEEHLLVHPEVLPFLEEVISKIVITDDDKNGLSVSKEVDFGRNIGINNLVETENISPEDIMLFAYRKSRKYPTHIVIDRIGNNCSTIVIQIKFDTTTTKCFLLTAYIGHVTDDPKQPFYISDKNSLEFKKSLEFWSHHALVYNSKIMDTPFESTWEKELSKFDL